MNQENKPAEQPVPQNPKPADKKTPEQRRRSVVHYIAVLFAAAFLLLGYTYLMEQRQHAEDLDQSITGLKDSVSAMQSVQDLYEENNRLLEEQLELKNQNSALSQEKRVAAARVGELEKTVRALDWFWQIDEAFTRQRWSLCRDLIQSLEEEGLESYLPKESTTDNDRFSPYHRYEEIRQQVF